MFTGLIEYVGHVVSVQEQGQHGRYVISCQDLKANIGDSIAINGCCLTVVHVACSEKKTDYILDYKNYSFDVSVETLRCTSLRDLAVGAKVNIERAMMLNGRLGGHLVSGHIDRVAEVHSVNLKEKYKELTFVIGGTAELFIVEKGSVSVQGVSLTVNSVKSHTYDSTLFSVMLIPETLAKTNLDLLIPGKKVNIEFDMIAKMVQKQVQLYMERMINNK